MPKSIFLETTEIPVSRSMGEITGMLAEAGAISVNTQFTLGRPSGLQFVLPTSQGQILYSLPVRVGALLSRLKGQLGPRSRKSDSDLEPQAERIAWRQLNAWVKAQLALIDLGMVEPGEVFMPYQLGAGGWTMWQEFQQRQLGPGKG
jgi:hypothetical protein